MCYIPDMTERFPEGIRGVDMTDSYFGGRRYDEYDAYADFYASCEADMENVEPSLFKVGDTYTKYGFYGGVTTYKVMEIDRENNRILLGEVWYDVDGTGTRPAKWHDLETDKNGNELALEWISEEFGKIWIYA